jgi:acetyltransferase EpsM
MKKLFIIGAGGLGKEVVDIVRESYQHQYHSVSFIDDVIKPQTVYSGVPIIGDRSILESIEPGSVEFCVAVGNPVHRYELINSLKNYGHSYATIIDRSALVRASAKVYEGVIIGPRAVISSHASIGPHAVINIAAVVGHDVSIGAYTVIGAGTLLSGGVCVEDGVLVGAGASILLGTRVGSWSKVAMGAAVFTQVDDRTTVMGNPARALPMKGHGISIASADAHSSPARNGEANDRS